MTRGAALFVLMAVAPAWAQGPTPARISADPERLRILAIEDARNPTDAELAFLIERARGMDRRGLGKEATARALDLRRTALTALGRLERRDLIPVLARFLGDAGLSATAQLGLLLTLRAHATAARDPQISAAVDDLVALPANPRVLGNLPYSRADQMKAAEARLRDVLNDPARARDAAARGLEALVRRNRQLGGFDDETIALLRRGAARNLPLMRKPVGTAIAAGSMAALLSAGVVDERLVDAALRDESAEVRRLGALALSSAGTNLVPERRTDLTQAALADRDPSVRYEALRAWTRLETPQHGCGPIVDALADPDLNLVLAAIDALGERCPGDEGITARLASEVRVPPNAGPWQKEAHALVALAHRAPDRAAMAMPFFARHDSWLVRVYAARAAAVLEDASSLGMLAYDPHDNVRDAAIPPLRVLKGAESDAACLAALGRIDYQLLRTVALNLKGAPPDKHLLAALIDALDRVTAQKKDTSRDTRLALMERIVEQGGREQVPLFERLLTDYDPRIASEAAAVLRTLTGTSRTPAPRPLPRPPPPTIAELEERPLARVELDTGRSFLIVFNRQTAPLAAVRLSRLIRRNYFDGLTFHRVVPNFVVQGGSPQANEYGGDSLYMPDEIGDAPHRAGTLGISTRGRDTGDAQLFVNLVDNMRLDFDYTVFGAISRPADLETVKTIQEGTRIVRIRLIR